ncbi:phosphotransferase [Pseudoalteromonas sp. NEC-BIFX-2020_015]|uniref:fructosamine kinase family protein n=1 Tax=Pseudoalteromonas sp. NEC-BIFX-2020_015 TaxID=2729544 RepID=UPI0014612F87|nr:fructosamine kinase family protein [Pseudoalteromonas sp. NEC-BIFX-2020_015]NMR24062.1 phosphotransferase [Pseudoalteromonas sp. NEC-BIFX-2020_015]
MWNTVNEQISQAMHFDFKHTNKRQLQSTSSDMLFKISDGTHSFLVKVAHRNNLERFENDAYNLNLLTKESMFMVPDCITTGSNIEYSFIALEWLTLDQQPHTNWHIMGQHLAHLHLKHQQAMFGFDHDNFIGATAQPNRWHKKWDVFFAEERIGWQLQLLHEKGIELVDHNYFVGLIKSILHSHIVSPSLLHGDFWRGNLGFIHSIPSVFNASCYYGDREVDIAMSELFAPLPEAFYIAYNKHYPLASGYEQRKKIYQLYPILNHANVFAGHYLTEAKQQIEQLMK